MKPAIVSRPAPSPKNLFIVLAGACLGRKPRQMIKQTSAMTPVVVFRCSPLLRPVLLFLLTIPIALRAQIVVPTTGGGLSVAVNPMTNKIYIPSRGSLGTVTVIDGATNVTKTITTGTNPSVAVVDPVTDKIYVTDQTAGTVIVIDGASDTVTATVPVGTAPLALAVNPVTNKVYVANLNSNNVTVIDGATNNVTATVPTNANNAFALAVNPVTNKIYVANNVTGAGNLTVIDGATNTPTPVAVSGSPQSVAVNPVTNQIYVCSPGTVTVLDGTNNSAITEVTVGTAASKILVNPVTNKAYVVNFANSPNNTVTVIDGTNNYTASTLTMGGTFPYTLAVNSVTDKIYVANFNLIGSAGTESSVTVIDGATNSTTTLPAAGNGANTLIVALNPVTNKIYTSIPGTVSVIDGAINAPVSTSPVPTGSSPNTVVVNPVTNKIYAPNSDSNTVTVIDVATSSVTTTVSVGSQPAYAAVDPVTNNVYVTNLGDGTVSVIDSANDTVTNTVTVGPYPQSVAVNPVTQKVYVAHPFAALSPTVINGNTVSVIDETTETVTGTVTVGSIPAGIAVNEATNKIYVTNSADNTVSAINGATNSVTNTVMVGTGPQGIAANPVTDMIYVANTTFNNSSNPGTISVIDGTSDTLIANLTAGIFPRVIAINSATNKIYVSNSNAGLSFPQGGSVTVIDGTTNTATQIAVTAPTDPSANQQSFPWGVAVNPITNNVYVSNFNSRTMMVIDGASNAVTSTIPILGTPLTTNCSNATNGSCPQYVLLYPAVDKIYTNLSSSPSSVGSVAVIDVDGHQTVPLTTTPAGVVDPLTVSTTNVFQTANRTPSFTVDVDSAYSSTSVYNGHSVTNPPPTQVYYEVDGANPANLASMTSSSGTNPASFTVNLSQPQQFGLHTLYVYAAYGNEGGHNNNGGNGGGNSPEIGNLTAYLFLVVPVLTTTTLTADVNPQVQGQPVIFTAQVSPPGPTGGPDPTGTVTFYDGTTVLGTGSITNAGIATFSTSTLSLGTHTITAAYSGDANYGTSTSSSLTLNIVSTLSVTIELVGGDAQSAVYGTAFAQPLAVMLTNSSGPVSGATVSFAGTGLNFSSSNVNTNSSGQAGVTATGTHVGILLATATTSGVTDSVNFALTVTPAPLTVTANNATRVYGDANPTFTGTVTGAVFGDIFTLSASTIATINSPPGTYPITPSVAGAALTNYTVTYVNGTLTITKASTLVTLTASPVQTVEGNPVTLTAMVNASATGTITFYDNGAALGTASIVNGVATLITSTLPIGTRTITASYSGDVDFTLTAPSALVNVTILAPDFDVTSPTPPQTVPPGGSANFAIAIPDVNFPYSSPVTLGASGLPAGASYTFNPNPVTPGAEGATSTLTINVPQQSAILDRSFRTPLVFATLLIPFALLGRIRGRPQQLLRWLLLVSLTSFEVIAGCGAGGYFNQPQRTYIITVTGTSGSLVHSTTVTLTVQ
jgi:YVTN family beta-propeller protein